ncbi:hypothetical protein B0H15DRAFT_925000 [Mycena belliarum]|uniref:NAD(P)-binding domain-containing protein n=1 Tax=Mycena belliarum TaxID=1033014 RepID=A0AAD6TTR2_9AGAR|nr:hypothetical protein B0H15DRAFT_925000 [Mycena belliae]
MSPNVLAFGASRTGNICYLSAIRLLEQGATVTFLGRNPAALETNELLQGYLKSGKARVIKGDATKEEDVRRAWSEAGTVDIVLFGVGMYPTMHLFKGMVFPSKNLVTTCILNVLCTLPAPPPKLILVSGMALRPSAHASLPLLVKPVYATLGVPHRDKLGMERALAHCAGWPWNPATDGAPGADIMGDAWTARAGLPSAGTFRNLLLVRPALLTDGKCVADEVRAKGKGKSYRVSEHDLSSCYTVSRADVAHFIVTEALPRWDEFRNKAVNMGY